MTADFSRRIPLRTGTPSIPLPRRQQPPKTLPIISLASFSNLQGRVTRSSSTSKSSTTTSSLISIDVTPESIRRTPIPRQNLSFPAQPVPQERNLSPRRTQLQLGRFLTYLRLQSLAKEKRRQRPEEEKPKFLIHPTRSPFHLILEPLERDLSSRCHPPPPPVVLPDDADAEPVVPPSSVLNTPRNSLADE